MMRRRNARMRHGHESGFALLLVFLMAAVVAISLYMEIPRVAFETQRQKEQLLVERGEQYKRAIKLFVSPHGIGRWPAKIEDLENTNNRRFLRHRFVDPFTGKDDWRLVHIQNGVLTDSVLNKPKKPADQKDASSGAVQSSVSALAGVSALPGVAGDGVESGAAELESGVAQARQRGRREPRDHRSGRATGPRGHPGAPRDRPGWSTVSRYATVSRRTAVSWPAAVSWCAILSWPAAVSWCATYPGAQQYPGTSRLRQARFPGFQPYPGAPSMPGGGYGFGSQPGSPGSAVPGYQPGQFPGQVTQYPGMPGPPVNSQTGGVSPTPYPTQPGSQGQPPNFAQPGLQGGQPGPAGRRRGDHQPDPDDSQPARTGGGSGRARQHDGWGHCRRGEHSGGRLNHGLQRPLEVQRVGVCLRPHQGEAASQPERRGSGGHARVPGGLPGGHDASRDEPLRRRQPGQFHPEPRGQTAPPTLTPMPGARQ